ncbi:hypothetical protein HY251_20760 [bacterium]|nr:hypothetical protein [bacterium]
MPVAKRRVRFGEAALQSGFIEGPALEKALTIQKERDAHGESHKLLGIILLEMGAISSEQLIEVLKKMSASALESEPPKNRSNGTDRRKA